MASGPQSNDYSGQQPIPPVPLPKQQSRPVPEVGATVNDAAMSTVRQPEELPHAETSTQSAVSAGAGVSKKVVDVIIVLVTVVVLIGVLITLSHRNSPQAPSNTTSVSAGAEAGKGKSPKTANSPKKAGPPKTVAELTAYAKKTALGKGYKINVKTGYIGLNKLHEENIEPQSAKPGDTTIADEDSVLMEVTCHGSPIELEMTSDRIWMIHPFKHGDISEGITYINDAAISSPTSNAKTPLTCDALMDLIDQNGVLE
ncbi:hypothetical protein [Bifidobacterium sp. ESL0800]|uniref:hypothetical protein n=1 Tax=Bifidobacterium sp. ESL0800 TaxID=2983236 RepID=UPI0023F894A2|nr:hypothetical protein [Bifidobacterium sp. ESL0800]WEV76113.1 hypothetical protein OZX75_02670 [Bifidobacterium sp. ESL0800]